MIKHTFVKVGSKKIEAIDLALAARHLIVLKGSRGYVMCGYLNQSAAEKFKDAAVKIKGVSSVADALKATVFSCTTAARRLGIRPGQPVREVLRAIV
ncbi:MAG TPA: DUF1805 domain-containing protein [Candidatus Omnitrophota bacterium]|nr:DUF1805 domain-containing protein [Candidatus Omnitrophota bacterium]HRZ14320.1 DUF1805 domain-containing protein [Candidatus Omnitrophota bacterium]